MSPPTHEGLVDWLLGLGLEPKPKPGYPGFYMVETPKFIGHWMKDKRGYVRMLGVRHRAKYYGIRSHSSAKAFIEHLTEDRSWHP